jgi:hypothetical protein
VHDPGGGNQSGRLDVDDMDCVVLPVRADHQLGRPPRRIPSHNRRRRRSKVLMGVRNASEPVGTGADTDPVVAPAAVEP